MARLKIGPHLHLVDESIRKKIRKDHGGEQPLRDVAAGGPPKHGRINMRCYCLAWYLENEIELEWIQDLLVGLGHSNDKNQRDLVSIFVPEVGG